MKTGFNYFNLEGPVLLIGAAYSGKSAIAQSALRPDLKTVVFGTADPKENGFAQRIAELKAERPRLWTTIEDNANIKEHIEKIDDSCRQILLDSLNQWVASRVLDGSFKYSLEQLKDHIENEFRGMIKALEEKSDRRIVLVSSEISAGIAPPHAVPRLYRELASKLNCRVAQFAKSVVLITAGLPLMLKGRAP